MSDRNRSARLLHDSLLVDMTAANSPIHPLFRQPAGYEPWIAQYREAGVSWLSMTVASDDLRSTGEVVHALAANRRFLLERPQDYVFVRSGEDVQRAQAQGKLGVNFNFQGSAPLEGDLALVEPLHTLGVGHMILAYNHKNMAGGGCHDPDDTGLSWFGRELVREMNRVGMVVDATHSSHRTTMDIFEASNRPVIFSHSNARGVHRHQRNIADDQIRACAAGGGVIGINGVGLFLSNDAADISPARLFEHIDYIADKVGHEHVGFGLDLVPGQEDPDAYRAMTRRAMAGMSARFGADQYPPELDALWIAGPSVIAGATQQMVEHGYTDDQIRDILGRNWLRAFADNGSQT